MADAQISDQKRQLQDQGSSWSRQQQWQNERAHNTARRGRSCAPHAGARARRTLLQGPCCRTRPPHPPASPPARRSSRRPALARRSSTDGPGHTASSTRTRNRTASAAWPARGAEHPFFSSARVRGNPAEPPRRRVRSRRRTVALRRSTDSPGHAPALAAAQSRAAVAAEWRERRAWRARFLERRTRTPT